MKNYVSEQNVIVIDSTLYTLNSTTNNNVTTEDRRQRRPDFGLKHQKQGNGRHGPIYQNIMFQNMFCLTCSDYGYTE